MTPINIDNFNSLDFLYEDGNRISSYELDEARSSAQIHIANSAIIRRVEEIFKASFLQQEHFQGHQSLIERHWSVIFDQALENAEIPRKNLLNTCCARAAYQSLNQVIAYILPEGFCPYSSTSTESPSYSQEFFQFLLHNPDASETPKPPSREVIRAILSVKDPALIEEGRSEVQSLLYAIENQKENLDHFMMNFLISQLLAIFAFLEPEEGQSLSVPVYSSDSDEWILEEFTVEKIQISPARTGPIYAYGLTPKHNQELDPILLFRGTPNYTADGYYLSKATDFTPGMSVGTSIYYFGRENLRRWMEKVQANFPDTKVQVIGNSLGGALAYHFAKDFDDGQCEVTAFNPPGLFERSLPQNTKGVVFIHREDLVSQLNYHPTSLKMIKIVTKARNPLSAHIKPYGCEKTIFLRVSPHVENKNLVRKIISVAHIILGIPFLIFSILTNIIIAYTFDLFAKKDPQQIGTTQTAPV